MKLGVRLVLVSVISVVLSSLIIGVASYVSIKKNFEKNALSVLSDGKLILQNYLTRLHDQIHHASLQIIARDDLKATVILVRDYEDPNHYDPMIFSGEKIKIVREISQYITLQNDLSYSVYDSRGQLLGSAVQSGGDKSMMFVSYEDGHPVCNVSKRSTVGTFHKEPSCSRSVKQKFTAVRTDWIVYDEGRVFLNETIPFVEKEGEREEIIGYLEYSVEIGQDVKKVLGEFGIALEYSVELPRKMVYEEGNNFFMDIPIGFEGDLSSWHLIYDKTSMKREIENAFYLILQIMIVSLLVSVFLGIYYARKNIEEPILQLIDKVRAFQEKHTGSNLEKSGLEQQDELELLKEYFINMENQVDTAIKQVKTINEELQVRVDKEVQRVREKDEMLITQSRNAALGEMINNIAHQWRQPITSIGLLVQNLEDVYEEGRLSKEYMRNAVEKALNQIEYMSQTINDFRNFFKTTKIRTKFSLRKSLDSVMNLASPQLMYHDLEVNIEGEDVILYGLENEFKQVILNVLMNAKDAILERMEEGVLQAGYINVSIFRDEKSVVVKISDNGGGMAPDIMGRIFEPYFTTKFKKQGTGIGLYMTKAIVEKHMQGTIRAKNIEAGAEFSICLPLELDD